MPLEHNELETNRFGIVAAHLRDTDADPELIDAEAQTAGIDLVTARVDVSDLTAVHRLESFGFQLMDTLVYYGRAVSDQAMVEQASIEGSIRLAGPDDRAEVGRIARQAFTDYMGHFHADPRLDNADADAAYIEWAETSTSNVGVERPVLVRCDGGDVVGFLTLRDLGRPVGEIVLNAVSPSHQGRGIYESLVRAALQAAADAGTERLTVSTQINNYGVQRVWARLGFVHERSVYTFHKWFDRR